MKQVQIRYCTLFDSRYLSRGLTMLNSLQPYLREGDEIVVLAMDDTTARVLGEVHSPGCRVIRIADLNDAELDALRGVRPAREFCWTCTPALCAALTKRGADGDVVVYLDADLMFFSDPRELIDELGEDGAVLIHEHRFSPDKMEFEKTSGRFNVGLVAFRVCEEAIACADRWRAQVIERCELSPEDGHCGDQGYLNEWPAMYAGVRILRSLGGGVAPWNVAQYEVGEVGGRPAVNGVPVVFYHYHALEIINEPRFGFIAVVPSSGYRFRRQALRLFYRPYAKRIRRWEMVLANHGVHSDGERSCHLLDVLLGSMLGRYVMSV